MKNILVVVLLFYSVNVLSQAVYNPSYTPLFTVASKPYAISQAAPVDGRTYKADSINFLWRPYNGTTEVLSYLNQAKYRTGQFPIEVNVGGTLNSNGTFTGGYIYEYWFRGGTADSNLVVKIYWPQSLAGFLQSADNLSDVASASTSRTNLGLGSMATQNVAASGGQLTGNWPSLTVAEFNGQLPSYYLNYNNLTNTPTIPAQFNPIAGTGMSLFGTYPNITFTTTVTPTFVRGVGSSQNYLYPQYTPPTQNPSTLGYDSVGFGTQAPASLVDISGRGILDTVQIRDLVNSDTTIITQANSIGTLINKKIYPSTIGASLQAVTDVGNRTDTSIYAGDSIAAPIGAISGTLYVGDSAQSIVPQDTIFGYGNSIMEGTGSGPGFGFFVQYCNATNNIGLDSGVSGTFLTDFQTRLPFIPAWTPRHKVMLLYETNDYYDGISLFTYLNTYRVVIDSLKSQKHYPDTAIVLLFCSLAGDTSGSLTPYGMVTWADSLDKLADSVGVEHVDLIHYMIDNGNQSLVLQTSNLHPNQSGHNTIFQAMMLKLQTGCARVMRQLFANNIQATQQMNIYAPVIQTYGNRFRQSSFGYSGTTDILTYSVDGTDPRPEIRGGIGSGDLSTYLIAANNQGLNKTVGIGAYTLTDSTGFPQPASYGFVIKTIPSASGETIFSTFSGKESGTGGSLEVSANGSHGFTSYQDGAISMGTQFDNPGWLYTDLELVVDGPSLLRTPGPFATTDKLATWSTAGRIDTIGLNYLPGPPIDDFAPTTGNTITLFTKAYNVITPAATIATLTINVPASPALGDWVKVKFNNPVTTITWAGGTVVAPTTSTQYQYFELHYNGTQWE